MVFFPKQLINSGFWIFHPASKARSQPFDHLIFGPQMKDATQQLNKRLFCLPGSRPRALKVGKHHCSIVFFFLRLAHCWKNPWIMYLYISGLKGRKQILTRLRLNPPWMSRGTLSRCIPPDFRGVMRCYQGLNSFSPTFHLNFLTFFLQFFPFLINIPLIHEKL